MGVMSRHMDTAVQNIAQGRELAVERTNQALAEGSVADMIESL